MTKLYTESRLKRFRSMGRLSCHSEEQSNEESRFLRLEEILDAPDRSR